MELGRLADGRPFVNVASAGLASAAARRAKPLKPNLGPLAYAVGALRAAVDRAAAALRRVRRTATRSSTARPGRRSSRSPARSAAASEIGAADPDDGVLDATVLPAGSRLGLARRAWGLRRGTIAEQRDVCHARGT